MYVCEELCFFLCSVSFRFLSLCSVVHRAQRKRNSSTSGPIKPGGAIG